MEKTNKVLFYFTPLVYMDCYLKGNMTYLRNFEVFFTRNYIIYFNSPQTNVTKIGKTIYLGVGGSNNFYMNMLISPIVLLRLFKRIKPDISVTTDSIFSFWSALLIRWFTPYFLYPIFVFEDVYYSSKKYFLPSKIVEKIFIRLSLFFAPKIHLFPSLVDPFFAKKFYVRKSVEAKNCVEEFPTLEFINKSQQITSLPSEYQTRKSIKLITVARLHSDKRLDEAVESAKIMRDFGLTVDLFMIGEGPERKNLENLAAQLKVNKVVHFLGAISNEDLVPYLQYADMYISQQTGTALREAILCEVPILAYNTGLTRPYFEEAGDIGYITNENTPEELAQGVRWYIDNSNAHAKIKINLKNYKKKWSLDSLKQSLEKTFGPYIQD